MNTENTLINYWAHMLDESTGIIDLSKKQGSMTQVLQDYVYEKLDKLSTVQQVYDLVKNTFDEYGINTSASNRLLFNIQRCRNVIQAMQTVVNSASYGAGYGVNGKPRRWRTAYEDKDLTEVKHSMHGPAWARKNGGIDEIADMREKLYNGVVEFTFWKHSDEGDVQRHAIGTTSEQIIPISERRRLDPNYDENVASYERRSGFIIWFWDLEKNAVRCFNTNRFDEIINYTPTTQHITPNVERIGNIFIHRDVDSNMENNQPLTDERIDQINDELENLIANNNIEIGIDHQANDIHQVYVDRTPRNEPVLRIEISKRGTDNDRPYELRINELRQVIRERYGIIIKKVTVDGTFQY